MAGSKRLFHLHYCQILRLVQPRLCLRVQFTSYHSSPLQTTVPEIMPRRTKQPFFRSTTFVAGRQGTLQSHLWASTMALRVKHSLCKVHHGSEFPLQRSWGRAELTLESCSLTSTTVCAVLGTNTHKRAWKKKVIFMRNMN